VDQEGRREREVASRVNSSKRQPGYSRDIYSRHIQAHAPQNSWVVRVLKLGGFQRASVPSVVVTCDVVKASPVT